MSIYEEFGVTPIVNLWGTATALGGSIMAPSVVKAMNEASKACARVDELQAAASKVIAEVTGAEAGIVTCGAAAALTMGAAACLTGLDILRMERLPDTSSMPNEVIMARDQRCGFDHAIRAAGASIVEVGYNESLTGAMRPVEGWEFEAAINEHTAAIALILYVWDSKKEAQLKEVAAIAKRRKVPLIVDAAGSVPPVDNLRRFISAGADLVAFSGGKGIRGPQNTGILCGRRDLIAAAAVQQLDACGYSHMWNPPESLIQKDKLIAQPRQGIGRPLKVSKEALIGLLVRLRELSKERTVNEARHMQTLLEQIVRSIAGLPHVSTSIEHPASGGSGAVPTLKVKIDPVGLGQDAFAISARLRNGTPRLWANEKSLPDNTLIITAICLDEALADVVGQRLKAVLSGGD
jgi:D-glucosaminate-6-phosphate ammonia-lyase